MAIKPLIKFALSALLVFLALLFVVQSGSIKKNYGHFLLKKQKQVNAVFLGNAPIQLKYKKNKEGLHDITIGLINQQYIEDAKLKGVKNLVLDNVPEINFSSFISGLQPLLILLSLIIASPVKILRKLLTIILGVIILHFFILFQAVVEIIYTCNTNEGLPNWGMPHLFNFLHFMFFETGIIHTIIPFVIWVGLLFKKSDYSFTHS